MPWDTDALMAAMLAENRRPTSGFPPGTPLLSLSMNSAGLTFNVDMLGRCPRDCRYCMAPLLIRCNVSVGFVDTAFGSADGVPPNSACRLGVNGTDMLGAMLDVGGGGGGAGAAGTSPGAGGADDDIGAGLDEGM